MKTPPSQRKISTGRTTAAKKKRPSMRPFFHILLLCAAGVLPAADLSTYRGFQLGMSLSAAVKHSGMDPSEVVTVQQHPARLDEMTWNPQRFSELSADMDPVQQVTLRFYNGRLARMAVDYDNQKTEGMTVQDFIGAVGEQYGPGKVPAVDSVMSSESFTEGVKVMARWEDADYSISLVESPYGHSFGLIAASKRLDGFAQRSVGAASELAEQQSPERLKTDVREAQDRLERERIANRKNFRP